MTKNDNTNPTVYQLGYYDGYDGRVSQEPLNKYQVYREGYIKGKQNSRAAEQERISQLIIKYPPDYNGELHINVRDDGQFNYNFSFTHVKRESDWKTLVEVAKAIVAQDARINAQSARA